VNRVASRPRPISLAKLGAQLGPEHRWPDLEISGLAIDSRKVRSGDWFFALDGARENGLNFVHQAIANGAIAVAVDGDQATLALPIPVIAIAQLREKLGLLASAFFGTPSKHLDVIAVTGTNGKTTVAHLCAQAMNVLGRKCGYVGTLGAGELSALKSTGVTTPEPCLLQQVMAELVAHDCDAVAIEASSHALAQSRLAGTLVRTAIVTGLGHDHLDYHRDRRAYFEAKKTLFQHPGLRNAVLNADDLMSAEIARALELEIAVTTFSLQPRSAGVAATLQLNSATYSPRGSTLKLDASGVEVTLESMLIGDVNAQNLLAALCVLLGLGVSLDAAISALSAVKPVRGRLERLGGYNREPTIFVDYAHSPDSLERVLRILRAFRPKRLFCVFGCGGDRDRSKRPLMGRIASQCADEVVITTDNPRSEAPDAIARAIISGSSDPARFIVIHDRNEAIEAVLNLAGSDDIVLIAGKGHETEQEIAGKRIAQSDQAIVRAWLERRP